ncbi:hypothetical protein [Nocardia asteroides]|uniref:hypothetical protein n=1 Tax=Nocardia asteroides TaxID=1824 RepID=UPI0033E5FFA1
MIRFLLGFFDHVAAERRIRVLAGALAATQRELADLRAEYARAQQRITNADTALMRERTERSSVRPRLTDAQRAALVDMTNVARLHSIGLTDPSELSIEFLPETSPGRGRDIRVWWADSDHVFMGQLDVYGNGSGALGEVDWVCDDASENQGCAVCEEADAEVADRV